MRFTEADSGNGYLIEAYGVEGIRVGGRVYSDGLILAGRELVTPWGPAVIADLDPAHLEPMIALTPELVLLGTGRDQRFPDPGIHVALARLGVGLEVMDTGAACRTYNILMAEGRRVLAALLPL